MDGRSSFLEILDELQDLCPAGYAMALHIRFSSPSYLFQTYDRDWMDYYCENGLALKDPTVRWGFENTGMRRWDALEAEDSDGVIAAARQHGLAHGFVLAIHEGGSRSLASFARGDRRHDSAEVARIETLMRHLHDLTADTRNLTPEERATLRRRSVQQTRP